MLSSQMLQLFAQSGRVKGHVDDCVETVNDPYAMSAELGTVHVVYVYSLEEALCLGSILEQAES